MRILLTGMSGVGKSNLVAELKERGYAAYDADDDGFSELRADGRWGWCLEQVATLLAEAPEGPLFFAGCSEEQAVLPFDYRVLLTVPQSVITERLLTRTNNPYGSGSQELSQVLADLAEVEPLLRRTSDLVIETTVSPKEAADQLLRHLAKLGIDRS